MYEMLSSIQEKRLLLRSAHTKPANSHTQQQLSIFLLVNGFMWWEHLYQEYFYHRSLMG